MPSPVKNIRVYALVGIVVFLTLFITQQSSSPSVKGLGSYKTAESSAQPVPENTFVPLADSGDAAAAETDSDVSDIAPPSLPKPTNDSVTRKPQQSTEQSSGAESSKSGGAAGGSDDAEDAKLSTQLADAEEAEEPATCQNDKSNQYVIMIDAGSTGSRVHVYHFDTCAEMPKLVKEEFEMLKPGLSSFDTDAEGAAKSLDPLLAVALRTIPEEFYACSPVAVKATAGLRLLGEEKSDAILKAVRTHLEEDFPFPVVPGSGIEIMSGKDEGVYAWITTNYLLGNIGSSAQTPTAAVFDLGGGSTQIVFEPQFDAAKQEEMAPGDHRYDLQFGNRDFELYQWSHLGYGLMEGRNKINGQILKSYLKKHPELKPLEDSEAAESGKAKAKAQAKIVSPCVPPGVTASGVKVKLDSGDVYVVDFVGPKTPSGTQCRFLAESVLNKDKECPQAPCSFNGVHQPSLTRNYLRDNDIFIFSYFYDRTFPLGMPSSFTVAELFELAKGVCDGSEAWTDLFAALDGAVEELMAEPHWCLDLNFIVSMLHTGYEIPLSREVKIAKKIGGNELGWCLGASLPLIDSEKSGWKCKITQEA